MENTLKELQEYQVCALQKGISYELCVDVSKDGTSMQVTMYYSDVSDVLDTRTFKTTFSNDDRLTKTKLERIQKFIKNIESK